LPVGDLEEVDLKAPALVAPLAAPAKAKAAVARPVPAPPTATPAAGTVDAYYEMANPSGALVPGQRLGASLPLRGEEESLSVPWTAVVIDVDGGTWVYEQSGPLKFVRRRVAVRHTLGEDALLASGPAAGTAVVLAGAQELFGAETGFVK
jgi:multidrug efflux pump subunit AcrA (membrane-fusion protein)